MAIPEDSSPKHQRAQEVETRNTLLVIEDLADDEPAQAGASYALSLLQNALDSLNEGLTQYRAFLSGRMRASKFAVLHFSHYLELLLKHCVAQIDEEALWISSTKTIGAQEALELLVKEGVSIPATFRADFKWFKNLRNNVEHFEFSLDADRVRQSVARLLYDADLILNACNEVIDFPAALETSNLGVFAELSREYAARLRVAIQKAKEAENAAYRGVRPKFRDQVQFHVGECDSCGQETFITNDSSPTGYQCTFCEEQYSDDMPMDCTLCGMPWTRGELTFIENWTDEGHSENACPRCLHHPDYVKDD